MTVPRRGSAVLRGGAGGRRSQRLGSGTTSPTALASPSSDRGPVAPGREAALAPQVNQSWKTVILDGAAVPGAATLNRDDPAPCSTWRSFPGDPGRPCTVKRANVIHPIHPGGNPEGRGRPAQFRSHSWQQENNSSFSLSLCLPSGPVVYTGGLEKYPAPPQSQVDPTHADALPPHDPAAQQKFCVRSSQRSSHGWFTPWVSPGELRNPLKGAARCRQITLEQRCPSSDGLHTTDLKRYRLKCYQQTFVA